MPPGDSGLLKLDLGVSMSVCGQGPKASDRTQVESKEVRLPDMPPITLDDTDVQTVSSLLPNDFLECSHLASFMLFKMLGGNAHSLD